MRAKVWASAEPIALLARSEEAQMEASRRSRSEGRGKGGNGRSNESISSMRRPCGCCGSGVFNVDISSVREVDIR